jgi:DNA-binding XRE family transcriptional regulator
MGVDIIVQDGRERVVMDKTDYVDLIDSRDHAIAMRDISAGAPTLTQAELDAYLAAPTPLAFWRQRAGKTQSALAEQVGVSQPFLAQIEGGQRQGTVRVLARLAKAVGVRIEDLIP